MSCERICAYGERAEFGELGWWHLGATAAVATAAGEHGGAVRVGDEQILAALAHVWI